MISSSSKNANNLLRTAEDILSRLRHNHVGIAEEGKHDDEISELSYGPINVKGKYNDNFNDEKRYYENSQQDIGNIISTAKTDDKTSVGIKQNLHVAMQIALRLQQRCNVTTIVTATNVIAGEDEEEKKRDSSSSSFFETMDYINENKINKTMDYTNKDKNNITVDYSNKDKNNKNISDDNNDSNIDYEYPEFERLEKGNINKSKYQHRKRFKRIIHGVIALNIFNENQISKIVNDEQKLVQKVDQVVDHFDDDDNGHYKKQEADSNYYNDNDNDTDDDSIKLDSLSTAPSSTSDNGSKDPLELKGFNGDDNNSIILGNNDHPDVSTLSGKQKLKSVIVALLAMEKVSGSIEDHDQWLKKLKKLSVRGLDAESCNHDSVSIGSKESVKERWGYLIDKITENHPRKQILDFMKDVALDGGESFHESIMILDKGSTKSSCLCNGSSYNDFDFKGSIHYESKSTRSFFATVEEQQRQLPQEKEQGIMPPQTKELQQGSFMLPPKTKHPLLQVFQRSSVFTIWRPTSMDAIRKMICREAVGKGRDIKGKSSKRGKHSGFVPFLQISRNSDKYEIDFFSKNEKGLEEQVIRLFLTTNETREFVVRNLRQQHSNEPTAAVQQVVDDHNNDSTDVIGNSDAARYINNYISNSRYGLEIPIKLFWKTFIGNQDITCEPGSMYDTGRPSSTYYQQKNLETICTSSTATQQQLGPRPVLLLNTSKEDNDYGNHNHPAMNPFELLIAYENECTGTVLPVVSDFDCFLVGTRRVTYKEPMEPNDIELLQWSVQQMECILQEREKQKEKEKQSITNPTDTSSSLSWMDCWTKRVSIQKDQDKEKYERIMCGAFLGFGDPKSRSINRFAIQRLQYTGAIQHGAESFNYHIPQELDDEFLIISERGEQKLLQQQQNGANANTKNSVFYQKVDQEGLLKFLHSKVQEGYTFPINPKWILCDGIHSGYNNDGDETIRKNKWKELYDLLLSDTDNENTRDSMNVWFPPTSGIREDIERICHCYPKGFYY